MDVQDKGRELFFLAQEARKQGCHAQAEAYLREALLHSPGRESIRTNLCGALIDQKKYVEALALCEALVHDFPANAVGWHRLSICQLRTGESMDALASLNRCIALTPDNDDALEFRVALLMRQGDVDAALHACRDALQRFPGRSSLHTALGVILSTLRDFTHARECHETALHLDVDNADKRWNLALAQLMLGDFSDGWQNFEARWEASDEVRVASLYTGNAPRWNGSLPLRGRTLLVWTEQGLGDGIQFSRFIPQLVKEGATVVFQVPGALLSLMRHNLPDVEVLGMEQPLPEHEFNLPLLSVPRFISANTADVPAPLHLTAPAFHRDFWRKKCGARQRPKVGLMWQGNMSNLRGLDRSMALAELAEVLSLPLDFYCVSNTLSVQDANWLRENAPAVQSFAPYIQDFSDTAALIEQLDLLVTIDTSVAHLGGSLETPTWILLARSADWRWQTADTQTPWYPESRLFRQQIAGEWSAPLQALRAALLERFDIKG